MTLKTLLNWDSLGKAQRMPMERWQSGGGPWEHKSHGHGSYKGGGSKGNSAALSALALLAFLFLLNVMQQSLNDNNVTATTTTTALLLRDEAPVLDAREQNAAVKNIKGSDLREPRLSDTAEDDEQMNEFKKGDTLG